MKKMDEISKVGFFGVVGNLLLMFLKFVSGLCFHSQAMIADAVNSFMDIFASLMTLMGGKIAVQPRDVDHNFGHGKAEFVFSLFVSISMIVGAFLIFSSSLQNFWNGHEVDFSILLLVVCFITVGVKLVLFISSRKIFQKTNSLLVYSNMADHRNDMIVTSFTLLSVILAKFHWSFFDSIVGIGISLWICLSGLKIFWESYCILMDQSLDETRAQKIKDFVLEQKGIEGITKFESTPAGYQYILILSILVDGNLTTFKSHDIADCLEKNILKNFSEILMVTIHVNPIEVDKKKKKSNK